MRCRRMWVVNVVVAFCKVIQYLAWKSTAVMMFVNERQKFTTRQANLQIPSGTTYAALAIIGLSLLTYLRPVAEEKTKPEGSRWGSLIIAKMGKNIMSAHLRVIIGLVYPL
ncbi:hypothetical protein P153DRAFT_114745 [Dothidotthia symphoricarpi CBS 119687]|uniref:Uncharacterized protein n=1 Tax=Dothidotthia symphoricarpi CBS 119687 TaxID=1392245 RepID=A0A6A6A2X9_9PLEO|nr:uncharacterized protein P153DRAFT_114745 [Dothidotthia symphoricarpi CBS 119687]KAF2125504.1 hypothetical protein P153DRAFT_114745 [Dothidotthia symphoricarpi CBS 119687]